MPTTSYPSAFNSAAVADESTPPDMATTTLVSCGRPSTSRLLSIGASVMDGEQRLRRGPGTHYYMFGPPGRNVGTTVGATESTAGRPRPRRHSPPPGQRPHGAPPDRRRPTRRHARVKAPP